MARRVKKKVQAVIETVQPKTLWQKVKDFFYNSESVFLTWLVGVFGTATSFIGYMDLSPLWNLLSTGTEFTRQQLIGIGISIVGAAGALYVARVRNTKEIDGHLLPKSE